MTFRSLIIPLLLALSVLAACGESKEAKALADADGSVWVIEGSTTRMYLCGTIHLLRKKDQPLPRTYDHAYSDSQRLVFELPPGSAKDASFMAKMQEAGALPAGASLSESVSERTWQALSAWCQERGMSSKIFEAMRPWMAALVISITEYSALGADPTRGVDQQFEARAKQDGKPGDGLETVEFQIKLFSELSERQQIELLEQTLAELKDLPAQYEDMIKAWRYGDADALHDMLAKEAEKYPDLLERFLLRRNAHWIERLEGYLKGKERVMVLVGGGHLGGKGGVIRLLQDKGYKVSKLARMSHAGAK